MQIKGQLKFFFGVAICVILPMAVYVMDVLITVNVIESKNYKESMNHWQDDTNKANLPIPEMSTFGIEKYNLQDTWFLEVNYN